MREREDGLVKKQEQGMTGIWPKSSAGAHTMLGKSNESLKDAVHMSSDKVLGGPG